MFKQKEILISECGDNATFLMKTLSSGRTIKVFMLHMYPEIAAFGGKDKFEHV